MNLPRTILASGLLLVGSTCFSQESGSPILLPMPRHIIPAQGEFKIGRSFRVFTNAQPNDSITWTAAQRCVRSVLDQAGVSVPENAVRAGKATAPGVLYVSVGSAAGMKQGVDESYTLTVAPDGSHLDAATSVGAVRGLATFRQLVRMGASRTAIPAMTIEDAPEYEWRGLMIDVARHFVPLELLKRNVDAMELVKLNVLHLHLSDNEGFRVESKTFPKLQLEGSNGEYYTQDQIRDLIRYAADRGIMIVPEFDMPSHSMSWMAGYPSLASSEGPFQPGRVSLEGLTSKSTMADVMAAMQTSRVPAFDPTLETTYQFLDQFVAEMAALFDSPYFHIGADENNGAVWRQNPRIVAFMNAQHIADTHALQNYFVQRVHDIVAKHGKTMVAWEEAYSESSPGNTLYQVWSPMAQKDLLRTPMTNGDRILVSKGFYLDWFFPAHAHYLNDTLPVSKQANPLIAGGEAAMWSELEDKNNIDSRIWPRSGAIAERLWSSADSLNPETLYARLFRLNTMLDAEALHHKAGYDQRLKGFAGTLPVEPVATLLNVLSPQMGVKRLMHRSLAAPGGSLMPLNRVADVVLVDSETKYQFRDALAKYLNTHDAASQQSLRSWLLLWSRNASALQPYFAQSKELQEVSAHANRLASLANAGLDALQTGCDGGKLTAEQLANYEALLKDAAKSEGETQLSVLPELDALIHGNLKPEPKAYPLF